ncbi:MAG: phosphoglycerate dehydrogenase [Zymomonas mobilis subsp. pomaceae]|uniref:D-3-phosphoglycerate dehydrogenase n=1 Tax=Zymomonas mobilis subsp. pomaceae (strain ATCC 29192 / DSM 22645 / JCM 10191 / CCUG 17912 / NBRC 13757 / NCIMB 11200 / NRRL B-4491 / Barker I) TaxID=579138 RepID=F8EVA4_ZYMMT|nr:phosphoglycerate dehydrogenase [Zymomonas mobilis]AEI38322.1 D-3-phosphoglycerate dehydrogenase [Zymomonas mobilis subsp. pomaceae ATCC 29192]MDX5948011.1 phosphoglycerate dehydrogenase [Zymomonas mobilis subsp. pomaceae]GEB89341.1 D-3-phosphoglycerate dehydrogenase [Zymomonas mobilis subsp. pomaceae]
MTRVLISDKMDPRAAAVFRERGVEVDEITGKTPEELKKIIGDYDGLAIRSATKVTQEIIAEAKNLKVIGRAGIGVDNIDIPTASAAGIVVMNTPFGNSITTAEQAIALMFAVARQIPEANASTQAGKWEKNRFMGVEVSGKTLGLIGAGNIGSIVADRAVGLKMKVVAYDPFLTVDRALELGIEKVELDVLFSRADFITLHVPLTDQTRNILSRENLAKTKKGVRIINCARGGLIDEEALKDALLSGHVAGAALDVFQKEPAKENPLFGVPNFVATPHLGASTSEAQVNVAIQVAEQMSDYLLTGGVSNALNMPSLSAEEAPRVKPYMALAEQLGRLIGQLEGDSLKAVSIEVEGAAASLDQKPITSAVLAGLMGVYSQSVNMVNAPFLARERDLDVREIRHDRKGAYNTLVRVTVKDDQGQEKSVAGTLFGRDGARLVDIFGIKVEANLSGDMLYIVNDDTPGFIGRLGSLLGKAGVNIGTFHLGRRSTGGEAVLLLSVDSPVTAGKMAKVAELAGVRQVKSLHFL